MRNIAIIGMGQGGMTSAIELAKAGFSVSVYEKCKRGEVSYRWHDDIRRDIFGICGLPEPSEDVYRQKSKWLFVSPNESYSLPVPPLPPMEEISVDRRGLSEYFARQLERAGGSIYFDSEVTSLVVEDEKVVGIVVGGEEKRCDLVIDASGLSSPFRAQAPKKFRIQPQPDGRGVLYGYRAFFRAVGGAKPIEEDVNSTLILKHLGEEGISWCNLVGDSVDVLVGRINGLTDEQIDRAVEALRKQNPILSEELIYAERVKICLRSTISRGVADGYIALGDSAYMTMPLMGSGIESSMKAGKLFADMVTDGRIEEFTAQSMWRFWREYMSTQGADFAFIDVLKSWALGVEPELIDWMFGGGLIEREDLKLISTDSGADKPKMSFKSIMKKIGLLLGHFSLVVRAVKVLMRAAKAKRIAKKCPKMYDEKKISRWQKRYERLLG